LTAVRATIVGGEPLSRGPELAPQVAALVRTLVEAAAARLVSQRLRPCAARC
jgi:hypothetical protein